MRLRQDKTETLLKCPRPRHCLDTVIKDTTRYDALCLRAPIAIIRCVTSILERCNPWPHVANRHISISQLLSLWRHSHYDVSRLRRSQPPFSCITTSFPLWRHSLLSWPRPLLRTYERTYGHLTAFNIKKISLWPAPANKQSAVTECTFNRSWWCSIMRLQPRRVTHKCRHCRAKTETRTTMSETSQDKTRVWRLYHCSSR